jgi:ribokinase
MGRVVVVGSLNCDLVMRVVRRPRKGETVIAESFDTFVGGKGCNQALGCARAGGTVAMVGRVGRDGFGDRIAATLAESGVDCAFLVRDEFVGTGIADILIDGDGENTICIAPQANARLSLADIAAAASAIASAGVVLLQLEIPYETAIAAARLARASGARVVLNPAPAPPTGTLPAELLANVDVIVPNQSEAELLTGASAHDESSAIDAARALQELGVPMAVVTMGALGAVLVEGASPPLVRRAFEVQVLDTTAAGDAFCGAFAMALAAGEPGSEALAWAAAAGALACTKLGAEPSLPSREDIERLLAERGQ